MRGGNARQARRARDHRAVGAVSVGVGQPAEVQRDELAEDRPRRRPEPGGGDSGRLDVLLGAGPRAGADVGGGLVGHHRDGAARRAQCVQQRARHVFLRGERPGHRAAGVADAGRIRSEEDRSGRDLIPAHGHGDGEVVTFEAPRPRLVAGRVAEDRDPVVAAVPAQQPAFTPVEYLFQGDDRHRLRVGMLAQPGGQQAVGGLAGGTAHIRDAGARPGRRTVLEPPARIVGERPRRKLALRAVE